MWITLALIRFHYVLLAILIRSKSQCKCLDSNLRLSSNECQFFGIWNHLSSITILLIFWFLLSFILPLVVVGCIVFTQMKYIWIILLAFFLTYLLTGSLTDRPTNQPTNQPTNRPTNWQTDWLTDWRTDGPTKRPNKRPTDWLTDRPTNRPTTDRPTDQPTDRLTNQMTDWLSQVA